MNMKIIKNEEIQNLIFKTRRLKSKLSQELFEKLLAIKSGETILITKDEWKLKTTPPLLIQCETNHARGIIGKYNIKIKTKTLVNDEGWIITKL